MIKNIVTTVGVMCASLSAQVVDATAIEASMIGLMGKIPEATSPIASSFDETKCIDCFGCAADGYYTVFIWNEELGAWGPPRWDDQPDWRGDDNPPKYDLNVFLLSTYHYSPTLKINSIGEFGQCVPELVEGKEICVEETGCKFDLQFIVTFPGNGNFRWDHDGDDLEDWTNDNAQGGGVAIGTSSNTDPGNHGCGQNPSIHELQIEQKDSNGNWMPFAYIIISARCTECETEEGMRQE